MPRKVFNHNHPRPVSLNLQKMDYRNKSGNDMRSFDFKETDAFIRSFGWAGDNPRGRLEDPALLDYDFLKDNYDKSLAGEYTINRTISLTGREQVARLKLILPSDIPKEKKRGRAAVAKWAVGQDYNLPDLRAMQYIYENSEEAKATNPKLFSDMKDYCEVGGHWIYPFFMGSIVRGDIDGAVYFSAIVMNAPFRHLDGRRLRNIWCGDDVLLVIDF